MNKIESSETIRKTTFDFSSFAKNKVSHKKTINKDFLEWFIGFTEGVGSFIVSKGRLFFIISQKEEKILYKIKEALGLGSVTTYKTYSRYIVADRENVDRLIYIFNGNLVLGKTNTRFISWIEARNIYCKENLEILPQNIGLSFEKSAWLSGFIDAEGCFNATQIKDCRNSLGFTVIPRRTDVARDKDVHLSLGERRLRTDARKVRVLHGRNEVACKGMIVLEYWRVHGRGGTRGRKQCFANGTNFDMYQYESRSVLRRRVAVRNGPKKGHE